MDRIAIAGLSLSGAEVSDLEALRVSGKSDALFLRDLADDLAASEVVHLATCNRVEVVFAREEGQAPGPEDLACIENALRANGANGATAKHLRFLTGRDAVRHLFRVVSSLDSLVQGEDQILSQVRQAYGRARDIGMTGTILEPVFKHAFQVGKQVRTRTGLSRHSISVMSLGVGRLADALRDTPMPTIAIVGAGAAARHAAKSLRGVGLGVDLIVNRTIERARELASEFDARSMTLDEFRSTLATITNLDAIVSATSSPGTILDARQLAVLKRPGRRLIGLDLAVPRDFEPPGAKDDPLGEIQVIDLEALRASADANRELRKAAVSEAEILIEAKLETFERKGLEGRASAMIDAYLADGNELLERQLSELRSRTIGGLDGEALRNVESWARSTFGRLSHLPIAACKQLARELPGVNGADGPDSIDEGETTG